MAACVIFRNLKSPSVKQAGAWYDDPNYASLIKLRQSGSDAAPVLVEGV